MTQRTICLTVTTDLTYDQRMIRICTALSEAGHSVTLIGRILPDSAPLSDNLYQQKRLKCWCNKGKLFYIEYTIRLFFFLILHKSFQIYTAIDLDTILPCLFISKLKGAKLYYDAHEYFTETPEVERRPFIKKIWQYIAKYSIPKAKMAYTVSPSLVEIFQSNYNIDFGLVMNMPFMKSNLTFEKPIEKVILYQGAINEGRGLESLVESMKEIKAQCWIIGDGDIVNQLKNKVNFLELQEKVKFLGKKSPLELDILTQQATIGINLIDKRSLSYYYSLANKFFDYVQFEIPQISMNYPDYAALNNVYEVGILVNDLEVNTLVHNINEILNNTELYEKHQSNCRKAKVIWNWDIEKLKLLEIYGKV
jgi:glycosyltransferase involved in cell wall biosynthesis